MDILALHKYFAIQSQLPQRLGVIDCVTFCIEGVKIGWGRDYLGELGYYDRQTAVKRLRKAGGLHQAVSDVLGMLRPISSLKPGDLIYFKEPATLALLLDGTIAIKSHYSVDLVYCDDDMSGWSTA